jgi:hypothetical protein
MWAKSNRESDVFVTKDLPTDWDLPTDEVEVVWDPCI